MSKQHINETLRQIEPLLKTLNHTEIEELSRELIKAQRVTIQPLVSAILSEIGNVLRQLDEEEIQKLVDEILHAGTIVVAGAGRMGMAGRGFAMRLGHLGLAAYAIGDTTLPSIHAGDLLLAASRSGETATILELAEIAKKNQAKVALVTASPESRMAQLADTMVVVKAPSRTHTVEGFASVQPMTTLNEQCMGIFFDALVLMLMQRLGETHESMWARHSNLE